MTDLLCGVTFAFPLISDSTDCWHKTVLHAAQMSQITSETLTNLHQSAVCKAISQLWMFYGHNSVPKMLQLTFVRVNVHICRGLCVVWKYIFVVHFSIWRSARQDLHGYDISPTLWTIVCINSLSFYQVTLLCRMNGVSVYLTLVILSRSGNCDRRGSE